MSDNVTVSRQRLRLGKLWIDQLTFDEAIDAIEALVDRGQGGAVFTPNVDHVMIAERNPAFVTAYEGASLSLVDGMPLVWASRLLGLELPQKISGSDLILPAMKRAAARRFRVYLIGAGPGVAEQAAEVLRREYGVHVVGTDSPRVAADGSCDPDAIARLRAADPELVLAAFGAPKQELFISRHRQAFGRGVALAIGAGLDFIAGTIRRAPPWISSAGLEWAYRLAQEPRRLARRYLLDDPQVLMVLARTLAEPKSSRISGRSLEMPGSHGAYARTASNVVN